MTTQKDGKAKKYAMQIVANIRFPNNRKPVTDQQGQVPGTPP
jgi:hypothetical protein